MPTDPAGAQLNIANGIREFAVACPNAIAVIDGDRSLSYAELDDRSSRLANALSASGIEPGARVALMLGNRLEFCEIACGIAKAGLVSVPVNPRLTEPEAGYILEHSEARAVVVERELLEVIGPACVRPIVLDDDYEQVLASAEATDPRVAVDETEPFTVSYTSGTTGKPKGVVISHRSRSLLFYAAAIEWGLGPGKTTIAVAPMYHGAGFALGYAGCHTGGSVVMLPKWNPAELLRLIELHSAGSVFLVPAHVQMLRALGEEAIRSHDVSALRSVYTNAAPMPQELKIWLLEMFPWIELHEMYGSTEAGIVTNLRPADQLRKERCVGPAWLLNEVRLLDPDGQPVPVGEPGLLWSRSPYVFRGYLKDAEATAAATSPGGWVTAGDIAVLDEDNCVYIVDRIGDMILSGGVNVYPSEIEQVLREHAAVADAAVFGLPDETWGERVVAVVVPEGAAPAESDLAEHCRARLAGFKVPKEIRFAESLPRNAAGKVLKRELRSAG